MRQTFLALALCLLVASCASSPGRQPRFATIKEVSLEKVYTQGASTGAMVGSAVGLLSGNLTVATTGYAAGLAVDGVTKDVVYDHDAWKLLVELEDGRIVRLTGYKYAGSQYEVGQRIEIISPIREDGGALFRPAK